MSESKYGGGQPESKYGGSYVDDQPLLEDTRPTKPVIEEDPDDASGIATALLSGLTNDETNKVYWLAAKRFPELVDRGMDPSQYYAFDEDGDLFYKNPYTGENKKEFADDWFGFDIDYLDNVGPAGQFLGEVIGGSTGMVKGFLTQGWKGAVTGGIKGTAAGGAAAYAARAALSELLGGPPLEAETAAKDLTVSALTGGIPFGAPTKGAPAGMKWIMDKFPGSDGRTALADIVQNGGKTVDDKLAYMAEKFPDVKISRAEANDLMGNAGFKIESWIAKNARSDKLVQHYDDRNQRINYHAERFFDHVSSGKYARGGVKDKLTGDAAVDPDIDIAQAASDYIALEKEKLAKQVAPLYKEAYDLDVTIDVSDILQEVDSVLANPNTSAKKLSAYKEMRTALIDARFEGDVSRSSTELLHEGLKDNFNRLLSRLTTEADSSLKREVTLIRNKVSNRLKTENPAYRQVTKIYDDAIGTAQILDRSIVGQFAKVLDLGGDAAGKLTKRLFSGDIKPAGIQQLKTVLQKTPEGAQAWQNLKGTWLRTRWEDVISNQGNPLSEPNAFLRALNIKQPTKAFPKQEVIYDPGGMPLPASVDELTRLSADLAEYNAKGSKAKMWKAIFEPEELANFVDLTDMMQMVGRIQTQGGSDTFGNFAMHQILAQEAKQVMGQGLATGAKQASISAGGVAAAATDLSSRIFGRGFQDLLTGARNAQKEAYMDLLISHIVDPKKSVALGTILEAARPTVYRISQLLTRGGVEAVDKYVFDTVEIRNKALKDAVKEREQERQESVEPTADPNLGSQIQNAKPPTLDLPMFEQQQPDSSIGLNFDPATSPTILPRDEDRELAMRLRSRQSGIAGLV